MGHFKPVPATRGRLLPFASIGGPRAPYAGSISRSRHGFDLYDGWQWTRLDGPALDRADRANASTFGGAVNRTMLDDSLQLAVNIAFGERSLRRLSVGVACGPTRLETLSDQSFLGFVQRQLDRMTVDELKERSKFVK